MSGSVTASNHWRHMCLPGRHRRYHSPRYRPCASIGGQLTMRNGGWRPLATVRMGFCQFRLGLRGSWLSVACGKLC